MSLYRTLDTAYAPLGLRRPPDEWRTGCATIDEIIEAIRNDQPNPTRSDAILRGLLATDRNRADATTVVLYALAPRLRARLGRAVSGGYRSDTLTDLAFVLLDTDAATLELAGLARRLVNRAHTRAHKAARRAYQRGSVRTVTIAPTDPIRFLDHTDPGGDDVAEMAARRVDLARFLTTAETAVANGDLSANAWAAYRAHRLARAVDADQPACDGVQRKLAGRAALRLQPLIDACLHAA
ncbi:MAG: hypothetical protein AB7H92_14735 [Microbacteriaceae bacterium]